MDRKEIALMLHHNNVNCAQSVICAFSNVLGVDPVTAFRMAEAFGFGMGCQGVCGAVSGMAMAVGLKMSDGNLDNPGTKHECYEMISKLKAEFEDKYGTCQCSELKDYELEDGSVRSCDEYIQTAVEILDRELLGL